MMKQYYTKKQYEELLDNMVILCQTNEQVNAHILDFFDSQNIRYKKKAIGEGDYSFMIKACPHLGFPVDTYFTDELFIERKNSLEELAHSLYGNKKMQPFVNEVIKQMRADRSPSLKKDIERLKREFSIYDDAFVRELKRARNKAHKYLLVEQPDGWQGILEHNYPNNYSEKAYWSMLHKIELEYDLKIKFLSKANMGREIYTICRFVLENYIER